MSRVAFIHGHDALDAEPACDLLVTSSYPVLVRAREQGRSCMLEHELLSREDIAGIQQAVAQHRKHWAERLFGERRQELLGFAGYLLDELVDYDLTFPFVEALTASRVFSRVLERERPTSLFCDAAQPLQRSLLETFGRARGIPVEALPGSPESATAAGGTARRRRFLRTWLRDRQLVRQAAAGPVPVYLSTEKIYARALLGSEHERLRFHPHRPNHALQLQEPYFALTPGLRGARSSLASLRDRLLRARETVDEASYEVDGLDVMPALRPTLEWLLTGRMPRVNPYRSSLGFRNAIHLLDVARAIVSLESLLRRGGFRLVVVSQDSLRGGAVAVVVARRLGIPSVVLQHGIPAEFFPLKADRMFFWGDYGADFYRRHGVAERSLTVTGNPFTGPGTSESERRAVNVATLFPGRSHRHLVTFVGQPYTGLNAAHPFHGPSQHLHGFVEEASRHPDDLFLVRPHTLEDAGAIRTWVNARGVDNVQVDRRQPLRDVLLASRAIVLHNSTVGLEALLLGRRILMLNFTGMPDVVPYGNSPNCAAARSPEEFSSVLDRELDRRTPFVDNRQDAFVQAQIAVGGAAAVSACHEALVGILDG